MVEVLMDVFLKEAERDSKAGGPVESNLYLNVSGKEHEYLHLRRQEIMYHWRILKKQFRRIHDDCQLRKDEFDSNFLNRLQSLSAIVALTALALTLILAAVAPIYEAIVRPWSLRVCSFVHGSSSCGDAPD